MSPDIDKRLRALCVRMKIDSDSRLFSPPGNIEFDVLAELEKQADYLNARVMTADRERDIATANRKQEEARADRHCKRADVAEGRLKAIYDALGITDLMNRVNVLSKAS